MDNERVHACDNTIGQSVVGALKLSTRRQEARGEVAVLHPSPTSESVQLQRASSEYISHWKATNSDPPAERSV